MLMMIEMQLYNSSQIWKGKDLYLNITICENHMLEKNLLGSAASLYDNCRFL
jgi:hypothetical protein